MVYIDYYYYRKRDGKTVYATAEFDNPKSAIRFVYMLNNRKDMVYDGFSCDDDNEFEYMNRRL